MVEVARLTGEWIPLYSTDARLSGFPLILSDLGAEGILLENPKIPCSRFFLPENGTENFVLCRKRKGEGLHSYQDDPVTVSFKILETDYEGYALVLAQLPLNSWDADRRPTIPIFHIFGRHAWVGNDLILIERLIAMAHEKFGVLKNEFFPVKRPTWH